MAPPEKQATDAATDSYTLELTLEELAFLRLLLTNATVRPPS
jgi:hypothetical protein